MYITLLSLKNFRISVFGRFSYMFSTTLILNCVITLPDMRNCLDALDCLTWVVAYCLGFSSVYLAFQIFMCHNPCTPSDSRYPLLRFSSKHCSATLYCDGS